MFDLRALIVAKEVRPKPVILPRITLTGITTILGKKIVFLTVNGVRPGERPKSCMLVEGQGQDGIVVNAIDEKTGSVQVTTCGREFRASLGLVANDVDSNVFRN